jgi:hypothetical protein
MSPTYWKQALVGLGFGILGGFLGLWINNTTGILPSPPPKVVTFDITKFINAERAIASNLLSKNRSAAENATVVLARVSKMVQGVIREEAGPGTLILVRQGVVASNVPDITNKVLRKLGLPTHVPTQSPEKYAVEIAPTEYSQGIGIEAEKAQIQQAKQKGEAYFQANAQAQNEQVLP